MDFSNIEKQVKQLWSEENVYSVAIDHSKPKYYILDMFPYPSGSGLHVGHPLGYVASDIYARYKRLNGFNVLHPMGFDAFGLPAEQYAIERGIDPAAGIAENIVTYRKQLDNIGLSYDWGRQVNTCDPNFYKWTQWVVKALFEHFYDKKIDKASPIAMLVAAFEANGNQNVDAAHNCPTTFSASEWKAFSPKEKDTVLMYYRLAYRSRGTVNWCEALGTVLANDEIINGRSERGGHPVTKKEMFQWCLRTTAYADRLLEGLGRIDWSDALRNIQRNWIGRSEGAMLAFEVCNSTEKVSVFTTRPDTLFGATFIVLAPEHQLVSLIQTEAQRAEVETYVAWVKSRSDVERMAEKKVTGVFTGAYCSHPFTDAKIPVYISEYVLAGYGTGAIMAVPSDDERDKAFAEMFGLEIVDVVDKSMYPGASLDDKLGKIINSGFLNGLEVKDAISAAIQKLEEKGIGQSKINYKMRDASMSRQRYWGEPYPIIYDADGVAYTVSDEELPVTLPKINDFSPSASGESPLSKVVEWRNEKNGFSREVDTMPGFCGSSWYWLRYIDPNNEQEMFGKAALDYWGSTVDTYLGGSEHAAGHLLYARVWQKFFFDLGIVPTDEPFKRVINQGMISGISRMVAVLTGDKTIEMHANVEFVNLQGRIYEADFRSLQAKERIFEMLSDTQLTWETDEIGARYIQTRPENEKMSKRYRNTLNPDNVIAEYGADAFRLFEMFLGPIEQSKPFDLKGIKGTEGFMRKFYLMFHQNDTFAVSDSAPTADELRALHTCIKKVREDVERFSMNTCVSHFMICINTLRDLKCNNRTILEQLVVLIAPFAPFMAEHLYQKFGNSGSVHRDAHYPTHNEAYLKSDTIDYPVQFNGKKKCNVLIASNATKAEIEAFALANAEIQKYLAGATPKKIIVVPQKMINFVV